jgi:hypothetical protein
MARKNVTNLALERLKRQLVYVLVRGVPVTQCGCQQNRRTKSFENIPAGDFIGFLHWSALRNLNRGSFCSLRQALSCMKAAAGRKFQRPDPGGHLRRAAGTHGGYKRP